MCPSAPQVTHLVAVYGANHFPGVELRFAACPCAASGRAESEGGSEAHRCKSGPSGAPGVFKPWSRILSEIPGREKGLSNFCVLKLQGFFSFSLILNFRFSSSPFCLALFLPLTHPLQLCVQEDGARGSLSWKKVLGLGRRSWPCCAGLLGL